MSGIDWQGLLKWSLHYNDGTTNSNNDVKPMTPEKQKFLEAALNEYYGNMKDPHVACQEAIQQIDPKKVDATMTALSVVRDLTVEHPELARNFAKIGAAAKLVECLTLTHDYTLPVVILVLRILADISQNNPELQADLVAQKTIRKLCEILKETSERLIAIKKGAKDRGDNPLPANLQSDEDELVRLLTEKRSRAMTSVSNIIRHNSIAEENFASQGGLSWIQFALQQNDPKFKQTALLLLSHLLAERKISALECAGNDPVGSQKPTILLVLCHQMISHDPHGDLNFSDLLIQTFVELWHAGGRKLPSDLIHRFAETVRRRIAILQDVYNDQDDTPGDVYMIDFADDIQRLRDLMVEVEDTGIKVPKPTQEGLIE